MSDRPPVNCDEALALLQDYLKQELTADTARDIEAHLDRCRDCLSQARFERNFLALLSARLTGAACPRPLRERIMAALRAEAGPH